MKKLIRNILTIMTAGIITLLSLNSCNGVRSDFDQRSCDAYLTCYYAGGLPAETAKMSYEVNRYLSDNEIEDIFYDLIEGLTPGFYAAVLEIDFFDWMDEYQFTDIYDFWWESTNDLTGNGYYAWDKRRE